MTVRCKGAGCNLAGTMVVVSTADPGPSTGEPPKTSVPTVRPATPPAWKAKTAPMTVPTGGVIKPAGGGSGQTPTAPASLNIVGTNPPPPITAPARTLKTAPLPKVQTPITSTPNVAVLRSSAGRTAAAEILKVFSDSGLWLRSVQFKNCQCVTEPDIQLDATTGSVKGLFADSWTYAHPSIAQYLFQLHPTEGKRAVALVVDWTKTSDRYVEYALKDMSSNKKFGDKDLVKPAAQTARDMARMRTELAGQKSIDHNEVRTCQIRKDGLVGLIWSPILHPTPLSDGGVTWDESKPRFEKFVQALQSAGAATKGLPIFTYEVAGGMTLTYIDFIA